MKARDEREKLESLLDTSPDKMTENVPVPGSIPEELSQESITGVDFDEVKDVCNDSARIMIQNAIGFILDDEVLANNVYLRNKLEVDIMSLSGMIYQVRVNEIMQKAMMVEIDRGVMHPRMFEVFSGLSKTIAEINKQLIGTVEAIKLTYKDIKQDIQDKENLAMGPGRSASGMITSGDGGVVTMGTKELINQTSKKPPKQSEISDAEELS